MKGGTWVKAVPENGTAEHNLGLRGRKEQDDKNWIISSFTVCTSCLIRIREDEKGGSRGTDGGEEKSLLGFHGDNREKGDHFDDLGIGGWTVLNGY
jgi:hypothetical protein